MTGFKPWTSGIGTTALPTEPTTAHIFSFLPLHLKVECLIGRYLDLKSFQRLLKVPGFHFKEYTKI